MNYDDEVERTYTKIDMNWLLDLPCVLRGEVVVDVRGIYPCMIRGNYATTVQTKEDVIDYVIMALPVTGWKIVKD